MRGDTGSTVTAPVTMPTASASELIAYTSTSVTTAASRAFIAGTSSFLMPIPRAAIAIESAPRTGRTLPSSASSPTVAKSAICSGRT